MPAHWHVLGAGAIGSLFAGALAEAGHRVTLILRQGRADAVCIECDGHSRRIAVDSCTAEACGPIHHLLLATKAGDTLSALDPLLPALADGAHVVLLQNGMGQHAAVTARLPHCAVYAALSTEGAWLRAPRHSVHAGRGLTRIGCLQRPAGQPERLWPALAGLRLAVQAEPDIRTALWQKLAVNAAINALAVCHDCRNGDLLDGGERQAGMRQLCRETAAVAAAEGLSLGDGEALYRQAVAVAAATAANVCSSVQDRRAGRRDELDAINGFLLERAAAHGLDLPAHRRLLAAARAAGANPA